MPRHSFIQMSKLPNVKGRISYITSHARQENLYATYRTADSAFWSNLARESHDKGYYTEYVISEIFHLFLSLMIN